MVARARNVSFVGEINTIIPIELKTGKDFMRVQHRAQVMLYVLMITIRERTAGDLTEGSETRGSESGSGSGSGTGSGSETRSRSGTESGSGFGSGTGTGPLTPASHGVLLYLNSEKTNYETVTPRWTDICSIMISRNDLAIHIHHSNDLTTRPLPPLLEKASECER
jgi:hypothetical protein